MEFWMAGNWISVEVPRPTYHECVYLITSHDNTLTYCLTLKHWNEPCPPRCPYYKVGPPGSLEKLGGEDYFLHCLKFTRRLITRKQAKAYCKLYLMSEPRCKICNYQQG